MPQHNAQRHHCSISQRNVRLVAGEGHSQQMRLLRYGKTLIGKPFGRRTRSRRNLSHLSLEDPTGAIVWNAKTDASLPNRR